MGNYKNVETEFVERTLVIIAQYDEIKHKWDQQQQYDHTLLVNCLLGLIVLPKEITLSYLPKAKLSKKLLVEMGLRDSLIDASITDLKQLVIALRHSVAHFKIDFISESEQFLIDRINFNNELDGKVLCLASFIPQELVSFIRYYGGWLLHNIKKHKLKEA